MTQTLPKREKLEVFLAALMIDPRVHAMLAVDFSDEAGSLARDVSSGQLESWLDSGAFDALSDLVHNEGEVVEEYFGLGPDDDPYPICIYAFGPVYWVFAPEFDRIEFFQDVQSARQHVMFEFG